MQHTCNQAKDLIIVTQCNGFVPVVRNAFFSLGICFFLAINGILGWYVALHIYMYKYMHVCSQIYWRFFTKWKWNNETDKKKKINDILIFLLHLLPRMRRLKTFVTPWHASFMSFFPGMFRFKTTNKHVNKAYDAVGTYVHIHGITWVVLMQL